MNAKVPYDINASGGWYEELPHFSCASGGTVKAGGGVREGSAHEGDWTTADKTIEWMRQAVVSHPERPLFVWGRRKSWRKFACCMPAPSLEGRRERAAAARVPDPLRRRTPRIAGVSPEVGLALPRVQKRGGREAGSATTKKARGTQSAESDQRNHTRGQKRAGGGSRREIGGGEGRSQGRAGEPRQRHKRSAHMEQGLER